MDSSVGVHGDVCARLAELWLRNEDSFQSRDVSVRGLWVNNQDQQSVLVVSGSMSVKYCH